MVKFITVEEWIAEGEALAAEFEQKAITSEYWWMRLWYQRAAVSIRKDIAEIRLREEQHGQANSRR